MRKSSLAFASLAVASLASLPFFAACSARPAEDAVQAAQPIRGGEPAGAPMVTIQRASDAGINAAHCSGAALSHYWVLTAGGCASANDATACTAFDGCIGIDQRVQDPHGSGITLVHLVSPLAHVNYPSIATSPVAANWGVLCAGTGSGQPAWAAVETLNVRDGLFDVASLVDGGFLKANFFEAGDVGGACFQGPTLVGVLASDSTTNGPINQVYTAVDASTLALWIEQTIGSAAVCGAAQCGSVNVGGTIVSCGDCDPKTEVCQGGVCNPVEKPCRGKKCGVPN
jgi:hypothetical protein